MEQHLIYHDRVKLLAEIRKILYRICCRECDLVANIETILTTDSDPANSCVGLPIELIATTVNNYGPVTYTWEMSDDNITYEVLETSTNSSYIFDTTGLTEGTALYFRVTASDRCHSNTSQVLSFTINGDPEVFISVDSDDVALGDPVFFHSEVIGGSGGNNYQWQELIDGTWTNILGANSADYTIGSIDEGPHTYRLTITQNPYCSATSSTIVVTTTA